MKSGMTLDRRAIGALLAGAALAGCAAEAQPGMMGGTMMGGSSMDLRRRAAEGGTFLMQTAQLGADRAQRPALRAFAPFEVSEQQGLMQAMMLVNGPMTPPPLPADKAEMVRQLSATQGAAFDALFIRMQVQGHQEAMAVYTSIQANNAAPAADRAIAMLAMDRIREHLAFLQTVSSRG